MKSIFTKYSKHRWAIILIINFAWTSLIFFIFNNYAQRIDDVNSRLRLALTAGTTRHRKVDLDGIPLSYSARMARPFVSPFYVIYYGLAYSRGTAYGDTASSLHWQDDPSWRDWHIEVQYGRPVEFRNCADWIVNNISYVKGKAHLLYDFDYPYAQYPGGRLKAPWWSGLSDAYALLLMLRADDLFHDNRYKNTARALYVSVTSPIEEGGSLSRLGGHAWIEEYIDPSVDPSHMSFVLNGMIYATISIEAYEEAVMMERRKNPGFYQSIVKNAHLFDQGSWSYYDLLGNSANLKYHAIHVSLLNKLSKKTGSQLINSIQQRWAVGNKRPALQWVLSAGFSVGKWHFIFDALASLFIFNIFLMLIVPRLVRKTKEQRNVSQWH